MNLPNKLTVLRIALVPVFMVLAYLPFPGHMYAALAVFILASLTDFLDGHLARKLNLITDFGKFMDSLADKILVLAALIKTASTMVCICLIMLLSGMSFIPAATLRGVELVCVAVILVTTVYSGIEYFMKNKDVFSGQM